MEPVRNNEVGPVSWLIPAPPARARAGPPPPEFGRPGPHRPLRRVDYHGHSPPGSHGLEAQRPLSARRSATSGGTGSSTGAQSPNNRNRSASSQGTLSPPASPKTLRNSTTLRAWTKIFEVAAREMYRLCEQDIAQSASSSAGATDGGRSRESGAIDRTKAALSSIEFALLEFHSLLRRSAVEARFSADDEEASQGSAMPSPLRKGGVGGVAWVVSTRSPLQPSEAFEAVADILHVLKQYSQYTQSADDGNTAISKGADSLTHARGGSANESGPRAPASAAAAAVLSSLPSPSRPNWHPTSSGREQNKPLAATARAWYPPLPKPTPSSLVVAEHFRRQRAQSNSENAVAALERNHSSDDDDVNDMAQTSENKTSLSFELGASSTTDPSAKNAAATISSAAKTSSLDASSQNAPTSDELSSPLLTPPVSPKGAAEKATNSGSTPESASELASAPWATELENSSPLEQPPPLPSRGVKLQQQQAGGFRTPVVKGNFDVDDDHLASGEVDTEAAVLLARRAVWDEAEAWVSRAEAVMLSRHCNTNTSSSGAPVPPPVTDYSSSEEKEFGGETSRFGVVAGASGNRNGEGSLSFRSVRNRQDIYSDNPGIRLELPPFLEFASSSSSCSSNGSALGGGGGFDGDHRSVRDDITEDDEDALSVSGISEAESAWSYEYSSLDGDDVSHLRHYDRPSSAASSPRSLQHARSTCSSSSGRRSRLQGSSRSRGRSISMPSGGFGGTLPLSSEKPVLRGAAAEAAAQEKASLWAANVEGLAAERRARTSRAEERRRAAYAKASGASSFKAQQLQEREARAAVAHTSRQRASVSFAVNNNQKVSEVAFMKSLSSDIFRDQLQRRLQDCEKRILDTTARRQALLQQRVEVAHHSSEKRKKFANSPAGSVSSLNLASPSSEAHLLPSPLSAVTMENVETAAGLGDASLVNQPAAVGLNDSMAAVKQAAKLAGVAATGTKRQILARLEKAKAYTANPDQHSGGSHSVDKNDHDGRRAKAGAVTMMNGPPPGLPLPSPFSPSTMLPASPPWSPARPSPTTIFPATTISSAATRRNAAGGASGANSSSGGSSGSSRNAEMSAERHAHEVEASERWQQLERRLEVLAKAASSAALRGDKPLFAAGPLSESNNAAPPREEDDEDDDEDEEEEERGEREMTARKSVGADAKPTINPEQKRKARKAQRKARMKAHQQQRRQHSRNDNDRGSTGDLTGRLCNDEWLELEAKRLRIAYLEAAVVVVPSADGEQDLFCKITEPVVPGLSEAVISLDQALATATSAFGLSTGDMAFASSESEGAAVEMAASREGRSTGRSVERCCRVLGEFARNMTVASTTNSCDHEMSNSTCATTATNTWEGAAVRLLARATAFAAAILRATNATATSALSTSEDKGINSSSNCAWACDSQGAALSALSLWTERSSTGAEALFTMANRHDGSLPPILVVTDVLQAELSRFASATKEANTSAVPPPPSVIKKSKGVQLSSSSSSSSPAVPLQPDRWISLVAALTTIAVAIEVKIANYSTSRNAQHVMRQYVTCFAATVIASSPAPPPLMMANFRMLKALACAAAAAGVATVSLNGVDNGGGEILQQLNVQGKETLWFDHTGSSGGGCKRSMNLAVDIEAALQSSLVAILRAHRPPSPASTLAAQPFIRHHNGGNNNAESSFEIPNDSLNLIAGGLSCLCAYRRLQFLYNYQMPLHTARAGEVERKKPSNHSRSRSDEGHSRNSKNGALLWSMCCKLLAHLAGPHSGKAAARADLADRRSSAHACVQELVEALGHLAPPVPSVVLCGNDHQSGGKHGASSKTVLGKDEGLELLESLVRLPVDFFFGTKAKKLLPTLVSLAAPGGVPNTQRVRVLRQHVDPSLLVSTLRSEAMCSDHSGDTKLLVSLLVRSSPIVDEPAISPHESSATTSFTVSITAVPWCLWLRAATCLEKNALDAP